MRVYTVLSDFCGAGFGALGVQQARARVRGVEARFELLGGFDVDRTACRSFERITGVRPKRFNVRKLKPKRLREWYGERAPDLIIGSPPCQGSSRLISNAKAKQKHYRDLNALVEVWIDLIFAAWPEGPTVLVIENVEGIERRGGAVLKRVRAKLKAKGYLFHDDAHELGRMGVRYDAGAIGGHAQKRRRWLLLARCPRRCPAPIALPPSRPYKGIGDVIGPLPLPGDPAAGPMHALPRIHTLQWIRLALIPAGGDHRDLPGVLKEHQERRAVFRRHHVAAWDQPAATIGGTGSNGPTAVADPRIGVALSDDPDRHRHVLGVMGWEDQAGTITGQGKPSSGAFACADPRIVPHANNPGAYWGKYVVNAWDGQASTITGAVQVGSGAQSVADPRAKNWFRDTLGVIPWGAQMGAITGEASPSTGRYSVADPRVKCDQYGGAYGVIPWNDQIKTIVGAAKLDNRPVSVADPRVDPTRAAWYGVARWDAPSRTIAAGSQVGQGEYSVADPRYFPGVGIIPLDEALVMLETPGPWAIVDRSSDGPPVCIIERLDRPPPVPLVIVAADGTWHRPLTPLELATLQGLPPIINGEPALLAGEGATAYRQQIGNAIPVYATCAIGSVIAQALLESELGAWSLCGDGGIWVERQEAMLQ